MAGKYDDTSKHPAESDSEGPLTDKEFLRVAWQ